MRKTHWLAQGFDKFRWDQVSLRHHRVLRETTFSKRGKNITLVCFFLPLKREILKMSDTCSLFSPFGDPWPSWLLPSHFSRGSSKPRDWTRVSHIVGRCFTVWATREVLSWQVDGEKMEMVTELIFLGSKIIVDGDCSYEIKRYVLLGRKAMTNLDSTLKSRDITLPTEVCLVKAMVFPLVMYGCELDYKESWAPKNWWRRLLKAPWTARSNQST